MKLPARVEGPVWRSYGPALGRPCARVWLRPGVPRQPVETVCSDVGHAQVELVVVDGAVPMEHRAHVDWIDLLTGLRRVCAEIEIETAGDEVPSRMTVRKTDRFVVRPPRGGGLRTEALKAYAETGKAEFVFDCGSPGEVDEVAALVGQAGVAPSAVWVVSELWTSGAGREMMARIGERALHFRFNLAGVAPDFQPS